jgi:hypothetical protein
MNKYKVSRKQDRTWNNTIFDSKKEMCRYITLRKKELRNEIQNLELQPKFVLQEKFRFQGKGIREISYKADFRYIENDRIYIEDVKGYKTEIYKLKIKMFYSKYRDELESGKWIFREV